MRTSQNRQHSQTTALTTNFEFNEFNPACGILPSALLAVEGEGTNGEAVPYAQGDRGKGSGRRVGVTGSRVCEEGERRSNSIGRGVEVRRPSKGVQECTSYLFHIRVKIVLAVVFEFRHAILHFGF